MRKPDYMSALVDVYRCEHRRMVASQQRRWTGLPPFISEDHLQEVFVQALSDERRAWFVAGWEEEGRDGLLKRLRIAHWRRQNDEAKRRYRRIRLRGSVPAPQGIDDVAMVEVKHDLGRLIVSVSEHHDLPVSVLEALLDSGATLVSAAVHTGITRRRLGCAMKDLRARLDAR